MQETSELILLDTYVQEHWTRKDRRLARILRVMDNVEGWVFEDEEDFPKMVNKMGRALSSVGSEEIQRGIKLLVVILAYMSSSKALRLLNWLEETHPKVFQAMVESLPGHERPRAARLFQTRLRVMNNLDLMGKVFNPNRSQRITTWLKAQMSQGATE
jgi:hypothetical protein